MQGLYVNCWLRLGTRSMSLFLKPFFYCRYWSDIPEQFQSGQPHILQQDQPPFNGASSNITKYKYIINRVFLVSWHHGCNLHQNRSSSNGPCNQRVKVRVCFTIHWRSSESPIQFHRKTSRFGVCEKILKPEDNATLYSSAKQLFGNLENSSRLISFFSDAQSRDSPMIFIRGQQTPNLIIAVATVIKRMSGRWRGGQ